MYELSRVRLHSVGPKGARYQDVVLNMRDVGPLVPRPAQDALFDAGEPRRRPSPASVLFSENGNGKSVLIRLIFSVMLPGKKQVVGTTDSRALEKFVLATDVAHVVLEWQHTVTGQQVITGKVSAWRGHVVSTDPSRLQEIWYSFRPTPNFNLDNLPLTESGRLVTLAGFRDRIHAAAKAEPQMELAWETVQTSWTEHLDSIGLDSELLAYQRKMNLGEGQAAAAFTFKSDEAFIDRLLRSVTDEEDPRLLADNLDEFADRLAEREIMLAERDFLDGALGLLGPLAAADRQVITAVTQKNEADNAAIAFAASLHARHTQDTARLTVLTDRLTTAQEAFIDADRKERRMNRIVLELTRHVARLTWEAAKAEQQDLIGKRAAARALLDAWQATGVVLAHREARANADALRVLVGEKERQAAGPLAARNTAAARLVMGLLTLAATATTVAEEADTAAADLADQIKSVEAEERTQIGLAATETGRATTAADNIRAAETAITEAVTAGLLTDGQAPAHAADAAHIAAQAAATALTDAETETTRLATEGKRQAQTLRAAERTADRAGHAAETAATRHAQARAETEALAAEERLAALLGTEQVLPETDADRLLAALRAAIETATTERDELRLADRADERVLTALGTGGLLPAPEDVLTVQRALEAEGIVSYTGWEYLATMPEAERGDVIAAYPHLIAGIVLNNPQQAAEADRVLTAARLLPRSIVAVGDTRTLTAPLTGSAAGLRFIVPPNPALYDEEKAATERDILLAARETRRARLTVLTDQITTDTRLTGRLETWQATYPAGALALLETARDTTAAAHAEALAAVAETEEQASAVAAAETTLAAGLPGLRTAATAALELAAVLDRLTERAAQIPAWTETARTAREAASAATGKADAARRRAEELRREREETLRRRDDQKRIVAQAHEEIGKTPGGGDVELTGAPLVEDVQTLRDAYTAAKSAYDKVEVGADLRAELARAEDAEAITLAQVQALPSPQRRAAERLLASPDGADPAARAAARDRADREHAALGQRVETAAAEEGRTRVLYEQMPPQEVALDPYGAPRDIAHGDELVTSATGDWRAAQTLLQEAEAARTKIQRDVDATRQAVDEIATLTEDFTGILPEDLDPDLYPLFDGPIEAARARRKTVRDNLTAATEAMAAADATARRTSSELTAYAAARRFDTVDSPVRDAIRSADFNTLPGYAARWAESIRPRLRSINDDLANINRHRNQIVTRLRGLVEVALKTLHTAEKVSTLPESLDGWGGQKFLRIRFTEADSATLDARLGEVIDDASGAGTGKRDGMTLLMKGVKAAMPRGVTVELLKPDTTLRTERVRVNEVPVVFSGGQLLTASIMLYCTLAALRANNRGETRRPHAGVLFLDNPLGTANAGYLLDLQLGVADALGVQLVYTSGVFDVNALSVFPLIVRLRNDKDLRTGMKYLTVEEEIRRVLDATLEPADGTGRLTAARLFRKAPAEASADPAAEPAAS
ncbi:hypothetical protein ACI797_04190 [Geodermatophilus sp. SYSU D00691]